MNRKYFLKRVLQLELANKPCGIRFQKIRNLLLLICISISGVIAQTDQVLNESGGTGLNDGLKIKLKTTGGLCVYRNNRTQYFNGYTWPSDGSRNGVALTFRFSQGSTYNSSNRDLKACSTTPVNQVGNTYSTSITGWVQSPFPGNDVFYVTANITYTYPNNYFYVDYYVRAPGVMTTPNQTVHLYLAHDAFILGRDASRGYRVVDASGEFVGDYRDPSDPGGAATHGFKTKNGFRSYYADSHSGQNSISNIDNKLSNAVNSTIKDDGVGVEFVLGPFTTGGQTLAKQVMHGYGNQKNEFNTTPVNDPVVSGTPSTSVTVNLTASTYTEPEGNTDHTASNVKISVQGGTLLQPQVCNFTLSGAVQGVDYTYVKGFTIPAGNYTTAQEFTLNNITIKGNTVCDNNRTFNVAIDSPGNCNDLILKGPNNTATVTIEDDEPRPTITTTLSNLEYYHGQTAPAIVIAANPGTATIAWTNSNTSIGLGASGSGNIPSFVATNNGTTAITSTITVTPTLSCAGTPKTYTIKVHPKFTISYYYNGGNAPTIPNPTTYVYGPSVTISNEPTRLGYTFAGWKCAELGIINPITPLIIPANSTSNLNLYADWGAGPNSYDIDYTLNGGTVISGTNPISYDVNTPSFTLKNPVKPGYTFLGWTGTGLGGNTMTVTIPTLSTGNRSYTANWSENTYTISYNFNSGTPPGSANKASFKITEVPFSINTMAVGNQPSRTGYTFTGWTGQNISVATKIIGVSTNSFSTVGQPENLSYMANWEPFNYTISYDLKGGSASNPTGYHIETPNFTLNNPTRPGYTFAGWTGTGLGGATMTVIINQGSTGNRSYTASWTADTYNIKYVDSDGSTVIAAPGAPATYKDPELPKSFTSTPVKPGWTFTGWVGTGASGSSVTIPAGTLGNLTYQATWSADLYTITFNPNGGTNPTIPSNWSGYDMTDLPINGISVTPTRTGYTFDGWTGHGQTNQKNPFSITNTTSGVPGHLTYTAQWILNTYNLAYDLHGGSATNPATYNVNSSPITLNNPTKTGYTFMGWTGTDIVGSSLSVTIPTGSTGNRTYEATWSVDSYTISYVLNGGFASNPAGYNVETPNFTLNNPTRPGYTFAGWTGTGLGGATMTVTINQGSTGNRSYTASWTADTYNIKYVDSDGSTVIAAPGAPATYKDPELPKSFTSTPVKPGWTFTGWVGTGASGSSVTIPAGTLGNLTYQATWSADPYTITFNSNGGTNPTIPSNWNGYDMTDLPINGISVTPTRTGYTFDGWTGHGQVNQKNPFSITNTTSGVPGHLTYTAQWILNTYHLAYDLHGGSATNPATYNVTSAPITLNNPTKTGYTFMGWTGTDIVGSSSSVTIPTGSVGDRSYEATWSTDGYTISYNLDGGTETIVNPTSYTILTPNFTLNNPTRTGYTFAGWTGTGLGAATTTVTINQGSIGNRAYTATWTPIVYNITYNLNSGTGANPTTYNIETPNFSLAAPVRPGYTFVGWTGSNGGTKQLSVSINQGSTGDKTYEAHWSANAYSITFNPNGGTNPTIPSNWQGYDLTNLPINGINPVPTRLGYTFKGWSGHGLPVSTAPFDITSTTPGVPGNLAFTAQWQLDTYSITYDPDGGIIVPGNPASYDITLLPIYIATEPTHLNPKNIFIGWTCQQLSSKPLQLVFEIPTNTTGNLDLKAHWTKSLNNLNPSGVNDTLFVCEGPKLLYGDPQGKSWEWVFPDGSLHTTRDVNALKSGKYICNTNYGTKIVPDTLNVYLLMENNNTSIKYITTTGAKVGKPQQFVLDIPSEMKQYVTSSWSLQGGGTIVNASTDSLTVIWQTTGQKKVSVQLNFNYAGVVCSKTLATTLQLTARSLGFFVDQNASGGLKDGSSWENAHLTIQDALNHATVGDQIWVAKGIYKPESDKSYEILQDSIEIYGGFDGTEEYLYERNQAKNQTILKGNGTSVLTVKNSSYIRIDGFFIEDGRADKGAGVLFENGSSGIVANCVIRKNNSTSQGGGIHLSAPWFNYPPSLIVNTEISGNQAIEGAGIYNNGDDTRLLSTTISGNKAEIAGGLYTSTGKPDISNTIIWGNLATKGNDLTKNIINLGGAPTYSHSIIGGSKKSDGEWNDAIGRDSTNNKDINPLFYKSGFESDGVTMRSGNYWLTGTSAAIDAGSNLAALKGVYIPWDILLQFPKRSLEEGLAFDLDNNERINNDRVDIGAYEHGAEPLNIDIKRPVILPEVEGLTTDPGPGTYMVRGHQDFVFTVRPKPGYSLNYLTVTTGIPIRDKEGILMEKNADGSVTVTIVQVWEPLTISINGVGPVSNSNLNGHKLWAFKNNLHINALHDVLLQVYTMDGKLCIQQKLELGESVIPLSQGVYTILLDDKAYKILISE